MKDRYKFIIFIFLIGIFIRMLFLWQSIENIPPSTDEAIIGLMSKHIIRGEFPIFFLGQSYLGPLDSYLGAFLTLFFGPTIFSVRLLYTLLSILFMFLVYITSKDVYGRDAGVLALLIGSIPSSYFMVMSSYVQAPYMSLMVIGAIIFYISNKIITRDKIWGYFLIFGLLSGLSIWMHFLSIVYIVPSVLFIFVRRPKIFIKNLWIGIIFFILGITPLLIGKAAMAVAETVDLHRAIVNFKSLVNDTLPGLLGIRAVPFIDTDRPISLPNFFVILATVIYTINLVIFIFVCINPVRSSGRLRLRPTSNGVKGIIKQNRLRINFDHLLLIFLLLTITIFCFGKRSGAHEYRYILPLYLAITILIARIRIVSRGFSYFSVAIILILNLYSNTSIIKIWNTPLFAREYGNLPNTEGLIDFLKTNNIYYTYSSYWLSYRLTFETNEEIISSQPYNERFQQSPLRYITSVDSAKNAAFIFTERFGISPSIFEENLSVLGGKYKKETIGDFVVFYNFEMPDVVSKHIPADGWRVSSNFGIDNLQFAYDRDIITRWGTAHPQEDGMYFKIDLGKVYSINKIVIEVGRFFTDAPRGYRLDVSLDDISWDTVINMPRNIGHLSWYNGHPKLLLDGNLEIIFKTINARYIRITQIGSDPRFDWSIAEFFVYSNV